MRRLFIIRFEYFILNHCMIKWSFTNFNLKKDRKDRKILLRLLENKNQKIKKLKKKDVKKDTSFFMNIATDFDILMMIIGGFGF